MTRSLLQKCNGLNVEFPWRTEGHITKKYR